MKIKMTGAELASMLKSQVDEQNNSNVRVKIMGGADDVYFSTKGLMQFIFIFLMLRSLKKSHYLLLIKKSFQPKY